MAWTDRQEGWLAVTGFCLLAGYYSLPTIYASTGFVVMPFTFSQPHLGLYTPSGEAVIILFNCVERLGLPVPDYLCCYHAFLPLHTCTFPIPACSCLPSCHVSVCHSKTAPIILLLDMWPLAAQTCLLCWRPSVDRWRAGILNS